MQVNVEVDEQTRSNRLILLTLIGLPITMILTASWLWYFVARGDLDLVSVLGTANKGSLLQPPRQLADTGLRDSEGFPFVIAEQKPRWTLLVPASGPSCDSECEQTLYVTRQIHVAMGKYVNRIGRYLVADRSTAQMSLDVPQLSDQRAAPDSFADYLELEHRGMELLQLPSSAHAELFAQYHSDRDSWYLVDPAGWVMMTYNGDTHYKDVISDLKFLLKNSGE